jgi:hypothetical protein
LKHHRALHPQARALGRVEHQRQIHPRRRPRFAPRS